ncbi:MAG: hypothetical protein A3I66_08605 [Burkholderiales bacterium RIFCSPLOWO2_02_FULL_57_36]|nr:MAG: hypothetical protein A3I66_08605 [Burkholderiales bacterium RIFCSPLOWO2_02_FULL_57_36]
MSLKMRINTQPKFITFSLKTLSAAVVSAVLFSNAYGAGLGKLTVLSSLGQPLHAEIELTSVSKDEAEALSVKLASVEAFRQANVEFNPALFALRFVVEQRGGKQVVRITSSQPINEPFVDMLLELGGGNSRLVREYTFLLDPPDLRRTQPVQIAAPSAPSSPIQKASPQVTRAESVPQPSATESPVSLSKAPAPPRSAGTVQPRGGANNLASPDDYQVKSGDTLGKIAGQYKPDGISLDQMLIGLQRANPNAFIGNNINRLRAGQILSIPDAETARAIPNAEAKRVVVAQSVDFNNYRNKLAEQAMNAAPQKSDEAKQSATGKITAKVEEQPSAASEAKDKLKLSRSGAAAAGADKGGNSAAIAEDGIAKEKALAEANARVKELEKNVADLQKILELKNKDLAKIQNQVDVAKLNPVPSAPATAVSNTTAAVPPSTATAANAPAAPATAPAAAAPPTSTALPAAAAPAPAATTADTPGPDVAIPAPEPKPSGDSAAPASNTADAKTATPSQVKPAVTPPPAIPAEPMETSLIDDVLENPLMLALMGGLLAVLGAFGIYSARRKKKLQKDFNESAILTDSSNLTANSLFGSTGGQSVDTNNSVFNSNFAPSASQLDTNEVDPVAEADVYIAYGRDAQAEEILKEALRTQPDRNAVRVKLLEIYANRKDLRAFELLASELYSITKGEGDDWEQAAGLGVEIDPQNPLYAGGKPPDAVVAKTAALTAPTQPLDELNLDALLNTTQTSVPPLESLDTVESGPSYFDNTVGSTASALPDLDMKAPSAAAEVFSMPAEEPVKPKAPAAAPAVVETAAPAGLDFDFDLPGLGIKEPDQPKNTEASKSPAEVASADNGLDFDFNLDSFAAKHAPEPEAAATEETPDVEIEELSSLDLNDSLAFGKPNATSSAVSGTAAQEFDLSGISLDLASAESMATVSEAAHEAGDSNLAEMATKLDLAIAYQEIGDKEGARELLDEVVKGGTSEQTEKAKSILQKIA